MMPSIVLKIGLINQFTCTLTITEGLLCAKFCYRIGFDKKDKCLRSHEAYVLVRNKDSNIK